MSRECIMHHHACNCREAEFAAITKDADRLEDLLIRIYNVPDLMFVVSGENSELAAEFEALIEEITE